MHGGFAAKGPRTSDTVRPIFAGVVNSAGLVEETSRPARAGKVQLANRSTAQPPDSRAQHGTESAQKQRIFVYLLQWKGEKAARTRSAHQKTSSWLLCGGQTGDFPVAIAHPSIPAFASSIDVWMSASHASFTSSESATRTMSPAGVTSLRGISGHNQAIIRFWLLTSELYSTDCSERILTSLRHTYILR